jgi:hypothetical protein
MKYLIFATIFAAFLVAQVTSHKNYPAGLEGPTGPSQNDYRQQLIRACEVIHGHTDPYMKWPNVEQFYEQEVCASVRREVKQYFDSWKPSGIDDQPFGTICWICGAPGTTGKQK